MIDNSYNKKSVFKSKWLYIVSALCILASGAGVWGAFNFYNDIPKGTSEPIETTTLNLKIEYSDSNTEVNNPVRGEPDTRESKTKAETTTEQSNMPYKGSFALPMGNNITKDYSNGKLTMNTTTGDWRTHDGVDFGGAEGSNVLAICAGRVQKVYQNPLWGNVIIINHGNGIIAKYCGLNENGLLKEGDRVKKYDVIGTLGQVPIEKDDGTHLHFEIKVNGKIQDPLKVMNKLSNSREKK